MELFNQLNNKLPYDIYCKLYDNLYNIAYRKLIECEFESKNYKNAYIILLFLIKYKHIDINYIKYSLNYITNNTYKIILVCEKYKLLNDNDFKDIIKLSLKTININSFKIVEIALKNNLITDEIINLSFKQINNNTCVIFEKLNDQNYIDKEICYKSLRIINNNSWQIITNISNKDSLIQQFSENELIKLFKLSLKHINNYSYLIINQIIHLKSVNRININDKNFNILIHMFLKKININTYYTIYLLRINNMLSYDYFILSIKYIHENIDKIVIEGKKANLINLNDPVIINILFCKITKFTIKLLNVLDINYQIALFIIKKIDLKKIHFNNYLFKIIKILENKYNNILIDNNIDIMSYVIYKKKLIF